MKKTYVRPTLMVENFVTEEIMDRTNPNNVLSYSAEYGGGYGDPNASNFINFATGDGNVINSIDYDTFAN